MDNKKLISSIDFGKQLKDVTDSDYRRLRDNYDKFLKQQNTLSMFVPCDDEGNVLEEPNLYNGGYIFEIHDELIGKPIEYDTELFESDLQEYQQAKKRVLFDGFDLLEKHSWGFVLIMRGEDWSETISVMYEDTIEDLLTYSFDPQFELTPSALKQFKI